MLLAACGGSKPQKKEEDPLDPYRSAMSVKINEVIYAGGSQEKVMGQLATLGVHPGKTFDDFKQETKIDDWFGEDWELPGYTKYTSLTCGLSLVVNEDSGQITKFYRSRKLIGGKMKPEGFIGPGRE